MTVVSWIRASEMAAFPSHRVTAFSPEDNARSVSSKLRHNGIAAI